jgi:hypothetical protein
MVIEAARARCLLIGFNPEKQSRIYFFREFARETASLAFRDLRTYREATWDNSIAFELSASAGKLILSAKKWRRKASAPTPHERKRKSKRQPRDNGYGGYFASCGID